RVLSRPALIEDVDISAVSRPLARSSNGTAEACLWVGNTATVRRAVLSSCAWAGLWTGTASRQSVIEDVRIDNTPVAVYLEHFTSESVFRRMDIGPRVDVGFNCEWADPAWGGKPGCVDNLIADSIVSSCAVGVFMGSGTTRVTVRDVQFRLQRVGAVVDDGSLGAVVEANDYAGIASGASWLVRGFDAASWKQASGCSRWSPA
ncbi:MAG: hypothetical protein M3T56_17355, partial [Chloroflexota bacterium]|nr:hypothetical protein [Chloroflexota bacterium]